MLVLVAGAAFRFVHIIHHSGDILLQSGSYQGVPWGLWADLSDDGSLCMWLSGPTTSKLPNDWAGSCAFNRDYPTSDYFFNGPGPRNSFVTFGPVPSAAKSVRIAASKIVATKSFPGGTELPAGRFWIVFQNGDGNPPPAWGNRIDPQPLDSKGHPTGFKAY